MRPIAGGVSSNNGTDSNATKTRSSKVIRNYSSKRVSNSSSSEMVVKKRRKVIVDDGSPY